jgi:hypothetical protein
MEIEAKGFRKVDGAEQSKPTDKVYKGQDGIMYSALELQAMMNEPWSNNACMGYVIMALEALKYPEEDIKKIIAEMKYGFDMSTIGEANQHYCKSPF